MVWSLNASTSCGPVVCCGVWQTVQPASTKMPAPPHLRVLYVTHGRHGQCLIVLDYHDQQLGADFRRTSIRTIQAVVLWLVAVFIREYD